MIVYAKSNTVDELLHDLRHPTDKYVYLLKWCFSTITFTSHQTLYLMRGWGLGMKLLSEGKSASNTPASIQAKALEHHSKLETVNADYYI